MRAAPEGRARYSLSLIPGRQRHQHRLVRRQGLGEDLVIAFLLPLPNTDGRPQVLAGILRIRRPIEIGELDPAAVDQAALRQIEFERDLAQLVWLEGLG